LRKVSGVDVHCLAQSGIVFSAAARCVTSNSSAAAASGEMGASSGILSSGSPGPPVLGRLPWALARAMPALVRSDVFCALILASEASRASRVLRTEKGR